MSKQALSHKLSVAPMLDWTDRHCRYFYRLMSKQTVLYTEMVTTGAIIFGKGDYLGYNEEEHPVVLQLGGSDSEAMAKCAKIAEKQGYDEININVGCPSDRVQNGRFGACLMAEPALVAQCVDAMKQVVDIPITVKSRIGIDDHDSYEFLHTFIDVVKEAGCQHFIVHARKAWLSGLSPKQNREIPPLDYERVYQVKRDFNHLDISINGGIKTFEEANQHLEHIDGVMIGREIYQNPYLLAQADQQIYGSNNEVLTRQEIIDEMALYIDKHVNAGGKMWHVARHMLGLCNGLAGAKQFRRFLSENSSLPDANGDLLKRAFDKVVQLQK
ncbi:tRNA dihydrouridine(20/20a) synthase DusA [Thalassotalea eurytherma]|uniref:tRNA-dihydrouridine(20/20a) synthase n=1 Tax=Thalassotalea eurytherma TaxID=1144278 RepID=A0ABQ6H6F3_9GAMM|nr:tRNA dihydrouridine(20/20a) synthase DusA [Thalassotalea eurytherma]GLX83733.1 tRNA-dihydrouridine(20/20a) synthase [Thalassotalea eurytherma]